MLWRKFFVWKKHFIFHFLFWTQLYCSSSCLSDWVSCLPVFLSVRYLSLMFFMLHLEISVSAKRFFQFFQNFKVNRGQNVYFKTGPTNHLLDLKNSMECKTISTNMKALTVVFSTKSHCDVIMTSRKLTRSL